MLQLPELTEVHLAECDLEIEKIFTAKELEKRKLKTFKLTQYFISDCSALLYFNQLALVTVNCIRTIFNQ